MYQGSQHQVLLVYPIPITTHGTYQHRESATLACLHSKQVHSRISHTVTFDDVCNEASRYTVNFFVMENFLFVFAEVVFKPISVVAALSEHQPSTYL